MKSIIQKITKTRILFFFLIVLSLNACTQKLSESIKNEKEGINGSFEIIEENLPVNWLVYTPKTIKKSDFDFFTDNTEAINGKNSLKFVVRNCSNVGGHLSPGISQEIEVEPKNTYIIKCWIKNDGSKFRIKSNAVSAFSKDKGEIIESNTSKQDWVLYELTTTIPEKMKRLRLEINVLESGTVWIDDISISKVE